MMDQTPKGIPEEVTDVAIEGMKEASTMSVEPVPEEHRPVADKSTLVSPVKKRRAWKYWTS